MDAITTRDSTRVLNDRNNSFGSKVHDKVEVFFVWELIILETILVLRLPLSLTVLKVEFNIT